MGSLDAYHEASSESPPTMTLLMARRQGPMSLLPCDWSFGPVHEPAKQPCFDDQRR